MTACSESGYKACSRGDWHLAARYFRYAAGEILRRPGEKYRYPSCLVYLGKTSLKEGKTNDAETYLRQARSFLSNERGRLIGLPAKHESGQSAFSKFQSAFIRIEYGIDPDRNRGCPIRLSERQPEASGLGEHLHPGTEQIFERKRGVRTLRPTAGEVTEGDSGSARQVT